MYLNVLFYIISKDLERAEFPFWMFQSIYPQLLSSCVVHMQVLKMEMDPRTHYFLWMALMTT